MIPTQRIRTGQTSSSVTLPAPTGGLNGRDSLADMSPTDAYYMDNFLPGTSTVDSREGCVEFVEAVAGAVKALEVYAGASGDKMLSFAGGKIYDVSTGIPSEKANLRNSDLPITQMFSNAADDSQHLIIVTGLDTPCKYDGTSIANLTMTGLSDPTTLAYVFAFKERLFFAAKDLLGFYYLPVGQIQGALSYFDLAQVADKGGYLVAMASYSMDAGSGPQDYVVFITSKGESIVYAGYDPSSAANWELVGRYYNATPIGRKCTVNYNGELVILTLDGAVPFSEIRRTGGKDGQERSGSSVALTDKLGRFLKDLNPYADVSGWCAALYPLGGWLILNAPTTAIISGAYHQYAMNTKTNAWGRITGWNCMCLVVFNRRLYFGTYDGRVMLAFEGRNDDGQDIRCDVKQAYNYFEDGNNIKFVRKHFQWAELMIGCDGNPPLSAKFNVDFAENQPDYVDTVDVSGADWDTSDWDSVEWGTDVFSQKYIVTLNEEGTVGSMWLRASLSGLSLKWYATRVIIERLRGLL